MIHLTKCSQPDSLTRYTLSRMTVLLAPAKLTWFLEITGQREDGYHELRSEMTTIDFCDRITIVNDADYLHIEGPIAGGVVTDATNLVSRALAVVGRTAGVTVEKFIPTGGGLGGGSADAAAILRWAGGVSSEEALTLGSDVPFCQLGGRALVEGIGEKLTPLGFVSRDVTLFMPSFSVNTRDCYAAFDKLVHNGVNPSGHNHLERAAGMVEPRLKSTLEWLRSEMGSGVQLAGSGSTMFIEGHMRPGNTQWHLAGPSGDIHVMQTVTLPS